MGNPVVKIIVLHEQFTHKRKAFVNRGRTAARVYNLTSASHNRLARTVKSLAEQRKATLTPWPHIHIGWQANL